MVRKGRGRKATSLHFTAGSSRVHPSSLGLGDKLPPPDHLSGRTRPRSFHLTARVFPSLVSPVGDSLGLGSKLPGMPRPPRSRSGNPLSKLRLPPRKVSRAVREKKSQTTLPSGPAWTWVLGILVLTVLAAALLVLRAQG